MTKKPLIYLATPFMHFEGGPIVAFRKIGLLTTALQRANPDLIFFSPITYGESLKKWGLSLEPNSWYEFDLQYLLRSDELWVLQFNGWRDSTGVDIEFKTATREKIPTRHYSTERDELIPSLDRRLVTCR